MTLFGSEKRKKRILVVDDEKNICSNLKAKLERTGKFEVYTTTNSAEGLEIASTARPDMLILDMAMPEMSGLDLAERLSEDNFTKDIMIVFTSTLVQGRNIEVKDGKILGRWFFVPKGLSPDEFVKQIVELSNLYLI